MKSVAFSHAQYKYWYLSIACTLLVFLVVTSTSYPPYTQKKSQTPWSLISSCLHHTHHFPFILCQPCSCYHGGAGVDIYTPSGHSLGCLRLTATYWGSRSGVFSPDWIPHTWELSRHTHHRSSPIYLTPGPCLLLLPTEAFSSSAQAPMLHPQDWPHNHALKVLRAQCTKPIF